MPPIAGLTTFERSNFFYGLLLDAERCERDHVFFNEKRWMLNRLAVGAGVLCGLDLKAVAGGRVAIQPGAALDGAGREIIVADATTIDPHQPTDASGQPAGALLAAGTVEIALLFHELKTDLVPVLVPDCDGPGDCAPSTIRESFVVIVRAAAGAPPPPTGCTLGVVPAPPEPGLHDLLAAKLRQTCPKPPADLAVPIARIDLATSAIDTVAGRPLVYSNRLLYELFVCLADRVSNAGTRFLRYVSGDGQTGAGGAALAQPLVVELDDAIGNPIAGQLVQFTVVTGGGSISAATATTGADGRALTSWTLGAAAGAQELSAAAVGTLFTVAFHATRV